MIEPSAAPVESVEMVRQAVVLAAGNGDRFRGSSSHSKLLTPIAGTPLLIRTLAGAWRAGITDVHIVLGYDAESVRALATAAAPSGLTLHFDTNHDWHRENGVSVLAARTSVGNQRFALLMGDHIFEPHVLERMLRLPSRDGESLLCVDRKIQANVRSVATARTLEATKVRLTGDRVSAIGKTLQPFDALDTGLFVCHTSAFAAIAEACAAGDSTLSGGIGRLAKRGLVRGVELGEAQWWDIDTVDDLAIAEELVAPAVDA
jgi:1L-myo-inositol 1-phosphate cytidylyltransferase